MCVQLRLLYHARLLKDYHLYRADIYFQTLSLPNSLLLNPVVRGCMEIGLHTPLLNLAVKFC